MLVLVAAMCFVANVMWFTHRFPAIRPNLLRSEVRSLMWPYSPTRIFSIDDRWEIWCYSLCPFHPFSNPDARQISSRDLPEEYEAYEVLFDKEGKVCTTVHVGETESMETDWGNVKGNCVKDYLKFQARTQRTSK